VVASELLLVAVEQFVARCHDEGCAELGGSSTRLVLAVAASEGSRTCEESVRADQCSGSETVHLDDVGGLAVLVEEDGERDGLLLNERFGVASPASAKSRHTSTRCCELFVSIADLTGPFATGCSAEVSEKQDDLEMFCPQIAQSMHPAGGIREREISEGCRVERHRVLSVLDQRILMPNLRQFFISRRRGTALRAILRSASRVDAHHVVAVLPPQNCRLGMP